MGPIELPTDPSEDPLLTNCDEFYSMDENYQNGCCGKCDNPNISPSDPCYQYCHCCEDPLKEMLQRRAGIIK